MDTYTVADGTRASTFTAKKEAKKVFDEWADDLQPEQAVVLTRYDDTIAEVLEIRYGVDQTVEADA